MKKILCLSLIMILSLTCVACKIKVTDSSVLSSSAASSITASPSIESSDNISSDYNIPVNSGKSSSAGISTTITSAIASPVVTSSKIASAVENQIPAYLQSRSASKMSDIKSKITDNTSKLTFMAIDGFLKYESSIYLPATWSTKSSNEIYNHRDIVADNIIAGECRVNVNAFLTWLDWTTVKEISSNEKMQVYSMMVKYKNISVDIFRAVYYNQTCSTCIVLDIRQDAMDLDQFLKLAGLIRTKYDLSGNKAGLADYSAMPAKVLILGNSFVGSSEIQSVLNEITAANKKNLTVEAESIGYATVETFTGNDGIMDRLKNNGYDFLFLCGFYQNSEIAYDMLMKEKSAITKIVIFPAHNESPLLAYEQFFKKIEAGIADWKGLIELLIENGMDKSRLCINDQHLHSTNLAGYAGACLIYSYLYKSTPNEGTVEARIANDQLRLGFDYDESIKYMAEIRQMAYNYLYDIS